MLKEIHERFGDAIKELDLEFPGVQELNHLEWESFLIYMALRWLERKGDGGETIHIRTATNLQAVLEMVEEKIKESNDDNDN